MMGARTDQGAAVTAASAYRPQLVVDAVSRVFPTEGGEDVHALSSASITVPKGDFVSLLGPSGCGKSTLFNLIAGLDTPTEGRVLLNGEDRSGQPGLVGYMLQKDLLLPWRTVLDNVTLGLEIQGVRRSRAAQVARPLLAHYGLGGFEGHYPGQLSGGMRQRAALLRTLLYNREVLLLDEPFGALDAQTRARMQEWLLDLWDDFKKTLLFVTHDIDEAIYLSNRVYVMSPRPGRIVAEYPVELERPRKPEIVTDPRFVELKSELQRVLAEASAPADDAVDRAAPQEVA